MQLRPQTTPWILCDSAGNDHVLEVLAIEQGFRLDGLAHALGCSARHLQSIFLRDLGIPPKRWLKAHRMVVARRMLEGGRWPAQVAGLLGFASSSNFGREFMAAHGVSPGRYFEQARGHRFS